MNIDERIAKTLGWELADVKTMSYNGLRDLVRPLDPELAKEITHIIDWGFFITRREEKEKK
jgi:hypothetical protein